MNTIPGKSRRKLVSEVKRLEARGVRFRYDDLNDVDMLFKMNRSVFGIYSYFSDSRFMRGFERLIAWLHDMKMLKIITVLIGGKIAAVDIGALWNNSCTMLAGGTKPEFPFF